MLADPLEATIRRLQEEMSQAKGSCQTLQRQWITCQRELITLQASNSKDAERAQTSEGEASFLAQRQSRLLKL